MLQSNQLKEVALLKGLLECPSISILDLSKNSIADKSLFDILDKMPNLRVLYLKGNPVVTNTKVRTNLPPTFSLLRVACHLLMFQIICALCVRVLMRACAYADACVSEVEK